MSRLKLMLGHRSIIIMIAVVAVGMALVMCAGGGWLWALALLGGAGTFLAYEWFHTTAHVPCTKTAVERHVTTLHNQHHFRDFTKWFHVTAGGEVIDRVMGTAIDREALKSAQRIEFIRTLGMRPDDARLVSARNRFAARYGLTPDEIARAAR